MDFLDKMEFFHFVVEVIYHITQKLMLGNFILFFKFVDFTASKSLKTPKASELAVYSGISNETSHDFAQLNYNFVRFNFV